MCPGKKDYCTKNKIIKQKRYLCDTMRNLHKKFLTCHPDIPVSYSFWCKNRPFWIRSRKASARDTCGCTCCMNMALLIQALHRIEALTQCSSFEVIKVFCCQEKTVNCLLRECSGCKENKITYIPGDITKPGHFLKWGRVKDSFFDKKTGKTKYVVKIVKQKYRRSLSEIIKEFEGSIMTFLKHKGKSLHQHIQISSKKAALKQNEVMIHMDFSENYALKYAEETQAFHFGGSRKQISLHTVIVYFKSEDKVMSKSFCTLSKSLRHDVSAIWAHLMPILSYTSEVHNADTLIFVSDSPATQYRNKTMFYFLGNKLRHFYPKLKDCSWNYWESGHGKGAPDGIGGVTKRTADRLVGEGKDIDSYEILIESLKKNVPNVAYFSIDENDIKNISNIIEKENIKAFSGTMQVHQVKLLDCDKGKLHFLSLSCFDVANPDYLIGTLDYSDNNNCFGVDESPTTASDSEDSLPLINYIPDKTKQRIQYEDVYSDEEAGPSSSVSTGLELTPKNIREGVYILVEYKTEQVQYRYAGITLNDVDDDEVKVMFLKVCKLQKSQAFRVKLNDVAFVNFDQIISILPSPIRLVDANKTYFKFKDEVDVFEKCYFLFLNVNNTYVIMTTVVNKSDFLYNKGYL